MRQSAAGRSWMTDTLLVVEAQQVSQRGRLGRRVFVTPRNVGQLDSVDAAFQYVAVPLYGQ